MLWNICVYNIGLNINHRNAGMLDKDLIKKDYFFHINDLFRLFDRKL